MTYEVHPATADRFADVVTVLGPKRAGAKGCWCLSYRLGHQAESALGTVDERSAVVERWCAADPGPGVLAYDDGEVVGWAGVAPRSETVEFTDGRRYPDRDRADDWVVWCFRVRARRGGAGVASALLAGAVRHAADHGASAVVGYPVDSRGEKVDRTLASFGVRSMFEACGFTHVGDVDGVRDGFPQLVMRQELA